MQPIDTRSRRAGRDWRKIPCGDLLSHPRGLWVEEHRVGGRSVLRVEIRVSLGVGQ